MVPSTHPWLGFVGRWERHYAGDEAAMVNSTPRCDCGSPGAQLTGLFDVSTIVVPPQLWVTVDGGPETLLRVDRPEIPLSPAGLHAGLQTGRSPTSDPRPRSSSEVGLSGFEAVDPGSGGVDTVVTPRCRRSAVRSAPSTRLPPSGTACTRPHMVDIASVADA